VGKLESLFHSEPTDVAEKFRNSNVTYQSLLLVIILMIVKFYITTAYTGLLNLPILLPLAVSSRDVP
jgi:hypothetical protein